MAATCITVLSFCIFPAHENENKNCNLQKFWGKKPKKKPPTKPTFKTSQYCLILSTSISWNPYSVTIHYYLLNPSNCYIMTFLNFNKICFSWQICSLMRGGIAERGGVRVGHRIIEINGQSVVATAHEKIVQALSNSVGEVRKQCLNTILKWHLSKLELSTNNKQLTDHFLNN